MSENQEQLMDFIYQGKVLLDSELYDEALSLFLEADNLSPNNLTVQSHLAQTYFQLGRKDEAEAIYLALEDKDLLTFALHFSFGRLLQSNGKEEGAEIHLLKALEGKKEDIEIHRAIALLYFKQNRLEEARKHFLKANLDKMVEKCDDALAKEKKEKEEAEELEAIQNTEFPFHRSPTIELDREKLNELLNDTKYEEDDDYDSDFGGDESSAPFESTPSQEALSVVVLPSEQKESSFSYDDEDMPFSTEEDSDIDYLSSEELDYKIGLDEFLELCEPDQEEIEGTSFLMDEFQNLLITSDCFAFTRVKLLHSIVGNASFAWENKRFQKKALKPLLGLLDDPVARVEGNFRLHLKAETGKERFLFEINEKDVLYLRSGFVLAFGPELEWENGRFPSPLGSNTDLFLEEFRGKGPLVVETESMLHGLRVEEEQTVRVTFDSLVGWFGDLVPVIVRDTSLSLDEENAPIFVDFRGEGGVLIKG